MEVSLLNTIIGQMALDQMKHYIDQMHQLKQISFRH